MVLSPGYSWARQNSALLLMGETRIEEALGEISVAEESDPRSVPILIAPTYYLNTWGVGKKPRRSLNVSARSTTPETGTTTRPAGSMRSIPTFPGRWRPRIGGTLSGRGRRGPGASSHLRAPVMSRRRRRTSGKGQGHPRRPLRGSSLGFMPMSATRRAASVG